MTTTASSSIDLANTTITFPRRIAFGASHHDSKCTDQHVQNGILLAVLLHRQSGVQERLVARPNLDRELPRLDNELVAQRPHRELR